MHDSALATVPQAASKPRRARRRWFLRLALAAALLACAAILAAYHWQQTESEQTLAELDRLEPGWRLADLEASRAVIPPAQNAAVLVTRLWPTLSTALNTGTVRDGLTAFDADWNGLVDPRRTLTDRKTVELRLALQPLGAPLAEARKLAEFPQGRFATNATTGVNWFIPNVDRVTQITRVLKNDVLLSVQEGKSEPAWLSTQAVLNAARSLGDEPLDLIQGYRTSRAAEAVGLMERVLAHGSVADEALAATAELLRAELAHPTLLLALRSQRAIVHHCFTQVETGQATLTQWRQGKLGGGTTLENATEKLSDLFESQQIKPAHRWLLRYTNDAVEIGKRPDPECLAGLAELEKTLVDAPPLARPFAPQFKYLRFAQMNRARIACGLAGLAVERFRLQHGRWPAALDEVRAAKLLTELPTDPYAGQPLRFRATHDGVVIYSSGPDGRGAGAALDALAATPPADAPPRMEFRLWHADRRGRGVD